MSLRNTTLTVVVVFGVCISGCSPSYDKLESVPEFLVGMWRYGGQRVNANRCYISKIMVTEKAVLLRRECPYEQPHMIKYRVKGALARHLLFSSDVDEYQVLTEGPNVVFEELSERERMEVYLQFWISSNHAPTEQLGIFQSVR